MAQKQIRRTDADKEQEVQEDLPTVKKADLTDVDELIDQIDEILDQGTIAEQERKRTFREKLRSINFIVHKRARCEDLISLPPELAEPLLEAGVIREAPPCIGCD